MAIWPFNRKSKRSSHSADDTAMPSSRSRPPERGRTGPVQRASDRSVPNLARKPSRKGSEKRPRSTSGKLSKSKAPSTRRAEKVESVPPIPALPEERRKALTERGAPNQSSQQAANHSGDRGEYYLQNPMSNASIQPEKFAVVKEPPTLYNKKSSNEQGLMRRKSSKRKKDDRAREQEVKAMNSPIPIPKRPKSHHTDLLARDNRAIPGDMNRNLERPLSNVSLPLAESLHSQMSTCFDSHAFKVNAFAALAPRPTIRYSGTAQSPSGSVGLSRTSTRKDKQPVIPESDEPLEKSRKRIDDLADDMDASSLRELMERDRRRLEQRRKSENERLQRRLQRKANVQRQQEEAANREAHVDDQPRKTVTPVDGRSPVSENLVAPTREEGPRTPESWLKDPSREHLAMEDPFRDAVHGASTSHLEEPTPTEEREEPILETAKAVRLSSAGMTPPLSPSRLAYDSRHMHEPSSLSQHSGLAPSVTPDIPETPEVTYQGRESTGGARLSTSWKTIFRRSDTKVKRGSADRRRPDRGRATPSEFSNTSRESVARQNPPVSFPRVPRVRSGTPIRTQSIFREDLPELPLSPPDSRMQSPETAGQNPLPNIPGSRGTDVVGEDEKPLAEIHPAYREEVALSRNASLRAKSPEEPPSATLSESLASVDAEGSWLTGRPVTKRVSTPQPLRESQRLEGVEDSDDNSAAGTPPAERYMGSLTPARQPSDAKRPSDEKTAPALPQARPPQRDPGMGIASSNVDDPEAALRPLVNEEGTTWRSSPGKYPIIVRPPGSPRVQSREGLLNDFQSAEPSVAEPMSAGADSGQGDSSQSPSEHSPVSPEAPSIQRATSVDFGKSHARHISAGSARLLNLPPRNSMEIRRLSSASAGSATVEKSPLGTSHRVEEETEMKATDVDRA